jgi:hypothetical protein
MGTVQVFSLYRALMSELMKRVISAFLWNSYEKGRSFPGYFQSFAGDSGDIRAPLGPKDLPEDPKDSSLFSSDLTSS